MRSTILVLALTLVSCGNVAPTSDHPPDAATPPDAPATGSCSAGAACDIDGSPGLCASSGQCGECVDTADDAKCAAAYGAGKLCIGGACVAATCHGDADCSGAQCIDNQCVGCRSDTDCADGEVCNTSGMCVAGANA